MDKPKKPYKPRVGRGQVSVRASVFEDIRRYAERNGERVSSVVDGILASWLDEHDPPGTS